MDNNCENLQSNLNVQTTNANHCPHNDFVIYLIYHSICHLIDKIGFFEQTNFFYLYKNQNKFFYFLKISNLQFRRWTDESENNKNSNGEQKNKIENFIDSVYLTQCSI